MSPVSEAGPLLEAERIHVRPTGADRDAVRDASLAVAPGEILALVGPNGSGKSTLLAALGGGLRPRAGALRLGGRPFRSYSARAFARRVARLPQEPACPEGLTVEALVASGRHPYVGHFRRHGRDDGRGVRAALRAMELADYGARPVETLSGGERRRAWIAMVLAQEAELCLLDEPTAALDLRHAWEVLALLREASRERGVALVVSLHDLEEAAALGHRLAVLHRGRPYEVGPAEQCLSEAMLRDVYGVDARVDKEDGRIRVRVRGPGDPIRSL